MKKLIAIFSTMFFGLLVINGLQAQCSSSSATNASWKTSSSQTVVGNAAVNPNKDIVSNLINSKKHTTLVAAVKAADLVGTLQGDGPFTVFAPVNDAFENLPEGTVSTLLKPENKATLSKILTYHVVAGKYDAASIVSAIRKGNGKVVLTTVSGNKLTAMMNGDRNVILKDENGSNANIAVYDVPQSNGIVHVIDAVVLPKG